MTYPINAQEFANNYVKGLSKAEYADWKMAKKLILAINQAYFKGVEEGRRKALGIN
ncbi:hypothetical protein [Clostridium sp. AM58-1XD]|uniref:hypothetical protein n=1 Tax=Clostridium sp. AM58-1XD TaxID=2292307 RepID=UPI0015F6BAB7|nr:hypothetical protein [Clostridium sp. AM58-1XD]